MILWVRRAAAVLSGIFLLALLFPPGSYWGGAGGAALNLAFAAIGQFPRSFRRFFPSFVLVTNTVLSAYGILAGGPAVWAMLIAVLSLSSWNAERFGQRWGDAPLPAKLRYLKSSGSLAAMGLGAGLSAEACQGNFSMPFSLALLSMLAGGVLLLRFMCQGTRKGGEKFL
jgi:hypothetical protein